jgi:uncharacterized protein
MRLTLAPKRYLVNPDYLLEFFGVTDADVVSNGDLLGRLLETFVVAQIRAEVALMSPAPARSSAHCRRS